MPTDTTQPLFVLVRPQMGENIGAAARAMWNFGLDRMRIVAPRDGWPNPNATAMAAGAGRLLDEAQLSRSVTEAVAGCTWVLATTARPRGLTKPVFTPEQAMAEAGRRIATGERVAILFGPERAGLENHDIARANAIVSVPVNPDFPSLNLAQCVLLTAYEWMRSAGAEQPEPRPPNPDALATAVEIERLAQHYQDRLQAAGFFFPPDKAESMQINLRNLWSRMPLTPADVRMLHGVMRQMVRAGGDGGG